MIPVALTGLAWIVVLVTLLWLLSLRLRDASIVDIFWGPGFVALNAAYALLTPDGAPARKLAATLLVSLWGLRLGIHLFLRNRGRPEDFRYRRWREQAGPPWWWQSYFKVFLLQGLLIWLIAFPLLAAQAGRVPSGWTWIDSLAVGVWAIGFLFESIGDAQLARFRSRPENRGRLLDRGLWRYTRHPNYFGDALQWWGLFGLAAAVQAYWTAFSPLLMSWLLIRVSGVALLERTLAVDKPGYAAYIASTSAFLPRPPRRGKGAGQGADPER
jgi:steroid 5-alpha reductase family enzyme